MAGKTKEGAMTKGFQQQDTAGNFVIPKSAATPQHGQAAEKREAQSQVRESRSFKPRPGH